MRRNTYREYHEKRRSGCFKVFFIGLLLLVIASVGIAFLLERSFPTHSTVVERLSDQEKARLSEIFHLKRKLGNAVWPGWAAGDIPIMLYNEEYVFLVGYPESPSIGWIHVRTNAKRGGSWEIVPDDTFEGQTYYRQRLPNPQTTPEDFIVRVGDRWVASMKTKELAEMYLIEKSKANLPPLLNTFYAYLFALRGFNSDWHICGVLHEAFHAYQATIATDRFLQAETARNVSNDQYPWVNEDFQELWQREVNLLVNAVNAKSDNEAVNLIFNFLAQRERRREIHEFGPGLVRYEREREWVEGLAKYAELAIWQQAATTSEYEPVSALKNDPDFKHYKTFKKHWKQEIAQSKRMTGDSGDGRFYYSGMLQATLLDRLMPDWKTQIMGDGVFLEELLQRTAGGLSSDS